MELVAIVTALALLQVFVFSFQVGQARVKYEIDAPAISGPPEFERSFRVHQNTVEQLVIFVPSLWMCAYFWRPDVAAGVGLVFVIARQLYRSSYVGNPANRSAGFGIGALAMMILLFGGLVNAVLDLF